MRWRIIYKNEKMSGQLTTSNNNNILSSASITLPSVATSSSMVTTSNCLKVNLNVAGGGTSLAASQLPRLSLNNNGMGGSPSPNVSIGGKRSRLSSKDKDSKKQGSGCGADNGNGGSLGGSVKKEISLESDLRNMMHAFGDCYTPLDESIHLMEAVLKEELQGFVYICDSIAAISGSKTLGLQEPIFAMRNEKSRLIRLLKYFATKDQQQKLMRMNQISQGFSAPTKCYLEEIRSILDKLDESGEFTRLLDSDNIIEPTKTEKAVRADKLSQKLNYPKYFAYSKARSVSFARKIGNLQDWITENTKSEFRMGTNFLDVLSFLAYEIVSQIIDLSFVVRRERAPTTNPIHRLCDSRAMNPETCMSAPAFQKRKEDQCNSVSEILVQASELEAKRLKKVATSSTEVHLAKNMFALTTSEISEAYSRFQKCVPPPLSYKVRAEILRRLNRQY